MWPVLLGILANPINLAVSAGLAVWHYTVSQAAGNIFKYSLKKLRSQSLWVRFEDFWVQLATNLIFAMVGKFWSFVGYLATRAPEFAVNAVKGLFEGIHTLETQPETSSLIDFDDNIVDDVSSSSTETAEVVRRRARRQREDPAFLETTAAAPAANSEPDKHYVENFVKKFWALWKIWPTSTRFLVGGLLYFLSMTLICTCISYISLWLASNTAHRNLMKCVKSTPNQCGELTTIYSAAHTDAALSNAFLKGVDTWPVFRLGYNFFVYTFQTMTTADVLTLVFFLAGLGVSGVGVYWWWSGPTTTPAPASRRKKTH